MPDCIIVRKPCCGAVVMAAVEEGGLDKQTKQELLELITQGCSVEHLSVEETRKQTFGCKCKGDESKGLFDSTLEREHKGA